MDLWLLQSLNSVTGRSPALDGFLAFSAKYLPVLFGLALIVLWASGTERLQRAAVLSGAAAVAALGMGQLIGLTYPRPRPYLQHDLHLLVPRVQDTSFPSDHATLGFAVAVGILLYDRRLGYLLIIPAAWLAIARVFVGAHYPTDVVAGAALGAVTSVLLHHLLEKGPGARPWRHLIQSLRSFVPCRRQVGHVRGTEDA